jgi:hypothetical protein
MLAVIRAALIGLPLVLSSCSDEGSSGMKVTAIPAGERGAAAVPAAPEGSPPAPAGHPGPVSPDAPLPPGHPPIDGSGGPVGAASGAMPRDAVHAPFAGEMGGMGMGGEIETDGNPDLPIRRSGLNSAEELQRGLASLPTAEARAHFELGFRSAFTTRQDRRRYELAEAELRKTLELAPTCAEAYRALAYAVFNRGLNFGESIPLYEKAVELKPDYGEAHYALAFMLGATDPARGAEHFRRAMQLGVKDERNLRARYYQAIETH